MQGPNGGPPGLLAAGSAAGATTARGAPSVVLGVGLAQGGVAAFAAQLAVHVAALKLYPLPPVFTT